MDLYQLIAKHEGFVAVVYCDKCGHRLVKGSTAWVCKCYPAEQAPGNLTLGIGTRVDGDGITLKQAGLLTRQRVLDNALTLTKFPSYRKLDPVRQAAIDDMAYCLGLQGLQDFAQMWDAIAADDWQRAHDAVLNSEWKHQEPSRALDDARILLTGEWPED